jgi:protocatechuate 3,4-dioxygenase beta subunit
MPSSTKTRTPDVNLGPFYPAGQAARRCEDLTVSKDYARRAQGSHLQLRGTVRDESGDAVAGAEIQIWQANCAGRYRHPCDTGTPPLDPGFDGFAEQLSDAHGGYGFRTVKPGSYRIGENEVRAPHIHFQVTAGPFRLVTQMFFDDEALNAQDRLLQAAQMPALLIAKRLSLPGGPRETPVYQWNLVVKRA